jgi:nucleotide-binding universal stress UspA family protein
MAIRLQPESITLLHVIELIQDMPYPDFEDFYRGLEVQAEANLEPASNQARGSTRLETRVVFGKRVQEILRFAETSKVDLLVLQSHPIDPTDPTRNWGTISYRVAILATCPVMLVK